MEDSGYSRAEAKAIVAEDMDEGAPEYEQTWGSQPDEMPEIVAREPVADIELTSGGEIKVRRS
jgi:hypothetical protein